MNTPTKAFISYARADGATFAQAVVRALEADGFQAWRDLRDLDALSDFSVEIERAIAAADVVVVCVTPSIAQAIDSFVRREILHAQSCGKPIVPLRMADAPLPVLINHLTWIPVADNTVIADTLAAEIRRRLSRGRDAGPFAIPPAPATDFVRALLDDILATLEATTTVLLEIATTGRAGRRPWKGGLPSGMQKLMREPTFRSVGPSVIGTDLSEGRGRFVLHGEPGSGKTTALLVAAREAANAWLEDSRHHLPVCGRAADWQAASGESIDAWLARSAPLLPRPRLQEALASGRVVLFIDGLDELPALVDRAEGDVHTIIDPRAELLRSLPPTAAVLVTVRTQAMNSVLGVAGFEPVSMTPVTEVQVAEYSAHMPSLAGLLARDDAMRTLARTPLALGLLSFVVEHPFAPESTVPNVVRLHPRLRLVHDYTLGRWQHEAQRGEPGVAFASLLCVLGRLATWAGTFSAADCDRAAVPEGLSGDVVLNVASGLGLVRPSARQEHTFFHPLFADAYATLHCWKHLGEQNEDGWDVRLFQRIAQLGDTAFTPVLVSMASGFWRGEFGNELALALHVIANPGAPGVADALVNLSGDLSLGHGDWIPAFVHEASPQHAAHMIAMLQRRAGSNLEAIHQLAQLGEPGVAALVAAYHALGASDPMRRQIASYTVVRDMLNLDSMSGGE